MDRLFLCSKKKFRLLLARKRYDQPNSASRSRIFLARWGDMVVALVEDGATVKRFFKEEGVYRLQPENDFMDPIIVESVEILGKVIGVFRFMK